MKVVRTFAFILIILTLNSCFLAITGAPHYHTYKEISGKDDLKLGIHCMYLNKTFEIRNTNPNDTIYIQSSSFNNPNKKIAVNHYLADSVRFYNWRIGDMRYHNKKRKDTINIQRISAKGEKTLYKFVLMQ